MRVIPHKMGGQLITDLLGGLVHYTFMPAIIMVNAMVKGGKMKPLAYSSRRKIGTSISRPPWARSVFLSLILAYG